MVIKAVKTERDEYAERVIEHLQNALKYAQENPQSSVLVFMIGRDGKLTTDYVTPGRVELLGMIEFAKAGVLAE